LANLLVPLLLVAAAASAQAGEPPPIPGAGYRLIDDFAYPDTAALNEAWQPMRGSPPAAVVNAGGGRALNLSCRFRATEIERASWDRRVRLDLTAVRGLRFLFFSPDTAPVSHFSFYLRSGNGWYAARFAPKVKNGWTEVRIDKAETLIEGQPAGWSAIDALRISAWRGEVADTGFYIANLGFWEEASRIVVIRGESVAGSAAGETGSVERYAKSLAGRLDELGLPYTLISDLDVTGERLRGTKLVILPHNPRLPESTAEILADFISGGGKLLSFYTPLTGRLAEAAGMRPGPHIGETYRGQFASIRPLGPELPGAPAEVKQRSWNIRRYEPVPGRGRVAAAWFNDRGEPTGEPAVLVSERAAHLTHVLLADDPDNQRMLLLAMLGRLVPEFWETAARSGLDAVGRFGPFGGWEEAAAALRTRSAGNRSARGELERAAGLRAEARRLAAGQNFAGAVVRAREAQAAAVAAYGAVQRPVPGEHRAWWCHSAFGPAGMDWDEAVRVLAENGFTAILPNLAWGGLAYYESRVLPVAAEVKERGDQLVQCLAACRKYGVACHVWKVNWNLGGRAPREFAERLKREGRTQIGYDGKALDGWLCPSHPANRQLEIEAMAELAERYEVAGIHFDYIRYPDQQSCFCAGCRERFEAAIGAKVDNWPRDTREREDIRKKWLDFRRDNITSVVAGVSERVRPRKPGVKISAAVFPNWTVDRDRIGQDWKLWCERGYLDFVCPMDYTADGLIFEEQVGRQRAWAGRVPCYPGIGLSVWEREGGAVKLVDFIESTRRLGTGGFTIFEYDSEGAGRIAPFCGAGITRPLRPR